MIIEIQKDLFILIRYLGENIKGLIFILFVS